MNNRTKKVYLLDEEKTIRRRRVAMELDADFVQVYQGIAKYTARLTSPWSFKYMLWLVTRMERDNRVDCSARTMREFMEGMRVMGNEIPTLRTIRRSLDELVKENVVIKLSRASYKINPVVFWSNEIGLRLDHAAKLIEGGHNLEPDKVKILSESNEVNDVEGLIEDAEVQDDSETQVATVPDEGSDGPSGI